MSWCVRAAAARRCPPYIMQRCTAYRLYMYTWPSKLPRHTCISLSLPLYSVRVYMCLHALLDSRAFRDADMHSRESIHTAWPV